MTLSDAPQMLVRCSPNACPSVDALSITMSSLAAAENRETEDNIFGKEHLGVAVTALSDARPTAAAFCPMLRHLWQQQTTGHQKAPSVAITVSVVL